jgi:hypothetical protein
MTEPRVQQDDQSTHLLPDADRRAHHELGEVAVSLYRLLREMREASPLCTFPPQDEEVLLQATCVLLEWDLIALEPPDTPV